MAKKFDMSNKINPLDNTNELQREEELKNMAKSFSSNEIVKIPIELIVPGNNIRDNEYIDDQLTDLGESIKEHGQIEPCIVSYDEEKKVYNLKMGNRRFRACYLTGIPTVDCIVTNKWETEKERIILQAIENEQRLNMSAHEREIYIKQLLDLGLSQIEIARTLHKNKGWVSEALRACEIRDKAISTFGNNEKFKDIISNISTRDAYNMGDFSNEEIEEMLAKSNDKKDLKKEISEKLKENKKNLEKEKSFESIEPEWEEDEEIEKTINISNQIIVNENNKSVIIKKLLATNSELSDFIQNKIQEFFSEKGYTCD